ncbi:transmembrane channel-like protein 6 isoform X6 [Eretmochelys imbricata]
MGLLQPAALRSGRSQSREESTRISLQPRYRSLPACPAAPSGTAEEPLSHSATTAQPSFAAGLAGRRCTKRPALHGPACGSTTWSWTPAAQSRKAGVGWTQKHPEETRENQVAFVLLRPTQTRLHHRVPESLGWVPLPPPLPPALASVPEADRRPLRLQCLVLLPLPQDASHVQCLLVPDPLDLRGSHAGQGYFTQTLMYYGYYSNFTLNDPCTPSCGRCQPGKGHLPYNMPLAYVFTIGVSFFSTCILLVYSMSRSFGESYRVGSTSGHFAMKVFCAWDYKVIQRRSVRLQNENIRTQLKELLGEWQSKSRPLSLCRRLGRMVVLSLAWALSLGTVLGCVIAVYYFSEHLLMVHRDSRDGGSSEARQEAFLLVLPMVVSLMNLVMPYLYNLLAAWEKQESPALEVYVAICRNLILKMVVLGLLCYHWLSRKRGYYLEDECWETSVGQELYRFVVMDFVFTLLDTFLGELLWRLILEKKLMRKQRPEFDIARNVLELIYGQTLTWLGVLFCPLLPAVQILKLVLLFYIKKTSLMKNCQSPSKPWRASHMSTVFITLLCFPSFLGAAIFLSYTIWAVRPSKTCGPFRMQETIYESGKTWVQELEKCSPNIAWFTWIHKHLVGNTFFLFFVSGVLLAVIYLHIQVVKGQRRIIRLLKEQIANEGEDKVFLIQRLQCIYGKQETHPCVPGRKELNA